MRWKFTCSLAEREAALLLRFQFLFHQLHWCLSFILLKNEMRVRVTTIHLSHPSSHASCRLLLLPFLLYPPTLPPRGYKFNASSRSHSRPFNCINIRVASTRTKLPSQSNVYIALLNLHFVLTLLLCHIIYFSLLSTCFLNNSKQK